MSIAILAGLQVPEAKQAMNKMGLSVVVLNPEASRQKISQIGSVFDALVTKAGVRNTQ